MTMRRTLRLGTRRSTLAWAQSSWVAQRLQALDPATNIELVPIETRGDRITNVPLREIEGKDFFTAELDAALLDGRVDLNVHSLKDLSLERPSGIQLGAIPLRENSRDVVIFRADVQERLQAGKPLRIGTSAPRRLENLPAFLAQALPTSPNPFPLRNPCSAEKPRVSVPGHPLVACDEPPRKRAEGDKKPDSGSDSPLPFRAEGLGEGGLVWQEIRGNVDTRLGRLYEPESSERRLDGVVLAFAGLIRLWRDERPQGGHERLLSLLRDIKWMVLPIAECPSAPGQGALAVECRADDAGTLALLQRLHDKQSATQVEEERAVLAIFGGGCHQKFGATCIVHPECGRVLYVRGKDAEGKDLNSVAWLSLPPAPQTPIKAWDGSQEQNKPIDATATDRQIIDRIAANSAPVFVAHSRALPPGAEAALAGRRVWTSGLASWRRLAERGIWVEGCADSLGFDWIAPTLSEPVLGLPTLDRWQVLTHANATESWPTGVALATYTSPHEDSSKIPEAEAVTHVFWASGSQFRGLSAQLPPTVHHACGPGKTAASIRAAGITHLTVFPSVDEWRHWLGLTNK